MRRTASASCLGFILSSSTASPSRQGLVELVELVDLDLDLDQVTHRGTRRTDRAPTRRGGDMVVLDQDRIVEPEAVIDAAADPHGVFLHGAQAGHGLARAADARLVTLTASTSVPVAVATPLRWPRKLSATRSPSDPARGSATTAMRSPGLRRVPSGRSVRTSMWIDQTESERGDVETGQDAGLAATRASFGPGRPARLRRREIAGAAQIFQECCTDDRLEHEGGKRGNDHERAPVTVDCGALDRGRRGT